MAEILSMGLDSTTGEQRTYETGDTLKAITDIAGVANGLATLDANAKIPASQMSSVVFLGSGLIVNTTDAGNVGTGEDDLMTYSITAGTLASNGQYIEGQAFGTFAANINAKTVRAYFGAQKIFDSGLQTQSGGSWELKTTIIRTGAATQRAITSFITDTALFSDDVTYTTPTETLSGAVTIKVTGEAVENNDIIQKGFIVKYYA